MPETEPKLFSIPELIAEFGEMIPCAGNSPVRLDDPNTFWVVVSGSVNVFLVELIDGVEQSKRQQLMRRDSGQILLPVAVKEADEKKDQSQFNVISKGMPGTFLKRMPIERLEDIQPEELAATIDSWISQITNALSRFVDFPPRPTALAEPEMESDFDPCTLSTRRGVVWVPSLPPTESLFMDVVDEAESNKSAQRESSWIPLTRTSWLSIFSKVSLSCRSTESMIHRRDILSALNDFHHLVIDMERINRSLALVDAANLERARSSSRRIVEKNARRDLFNLYGLRDRTSEADHNKNLMDVLHSIGQKEGIEFKVPKRLGTSQAPLKLTEILDSSGIRSRQMTLVHADKWWREDAGALLAYHSESGHPVALLPRLFGGYKIVDPRQPKSISLDQKHAQMLHEKAWMFYPPLPPNDAQPGDMLRIALKGSSGAILRLVVSGVLKGVMTVVCALALGFIVQKLASGGDMLSLYVLVGTLSLFGLVGGLLNLLQSKALTRLSSRALARAEASLWDRILRIPESHLPDQSIGDLAMSSMVFHKMREGAEGVIANSVLLVMFLIPPLVLTLFYDLTLGLISLLFSFAALMITILLGYRLISPQIRLIYASRSVTSRLFQIISGITKLRVELAEGSAYAVWSQHYRDQKLAEIEMGRRQSHSHAFASALPFFAVGLFFLAWVNTGGESIESLTQFLIVFAIFWSFQSALSRFSFSCGDIASSLPAFRQLKPVISAKPEIEDQGESIDFLGGHLLFDKVSFRYDADGPLILDDVTIQAQSGEFVAIAGESGAGKSTLFRLGLGLNRPTSGAVLYDGRDLQNLNLKQVRRMIGAVPQSIRLHPQDIWDNVVMHRVMASNEDVWKSTRLSGIESQIKAMPMGMMTPVGSSESVLSGGESQRISIARALLGNPRIILLDEATNWLDNANQAEFMKNLMMLVATRVVIAHRLSTLEKADRIYVLQGGRVVQVGSYGELAAEEGLFKRLIQRQIV